MVIGSEGVDIYPNWKHVREPITEGRRVKSIYLISAESTYIQNKEERDNCPMTCKAWTFKLSHSKL